MHLLGRYLAFQRCNGLRHLSRKSRLSALRNRCAHVQAECEQLKGQIELQRQLMTSEAVAGTTIDRQRLFSWMRKNAIILRKIQELQLDLVSGETLRAECEQKYESQRLLCKQLELKHEKYTNLILVERKKQWIKSINFEDSEIEGQLLWTK